MATIVGTTYLNGCNYQVGYDLLSQSQSGNYSVVRFYGILNVTNNYISWSRGTAQVWNNSVGIGTYYSKGSYTLVSQDVTLYHDNNGNYSATLTGSLNTTFVSGSANGGFSLPHINRYPVISSASNFTDEENPIIRFSSYGTYSLRAKIEVGGNTQLITRDLASKSATSYTFELTDKERDALISLAGAKDTLSVRFTICAMSGNTELSASYLDRTMTVVPKGRLYINGEWERVIAYYGKKGEWKKVKVYIGKDGEWKRGK